MKLDDLYDSSKIFYHGTNATFDVFDPKKSAVGVAQEGPGFYFTSLESDAHRYGNIILECELNFRKNHLLTKTPPKLREIETLIKNAPNFKQQIIDNWGESFAIGYKQAVEAYSNYDNKHDCFTTIWNDFYHDSADVYLKTLTSKLNYDAYIVGQGVLHVIMFDSSRIRILSRKKIS